MTPATPIKLIELQILEGLAACKSIQQIAEAIAVVVAKQLISESQAN